MRYCLKKEQTQGTMNCLLIEQRINSLPQDCSKFNFPGGYLRVLTMKRKNLTLLFLIASLCCFAVRQGYADTSIKVCETKNSNITGSPVFYLKSEGKNLTDSQDNPSPGTCENIWTKEASPIGKGIDVRLKPSQGISSYHTIGTVVFSSPEDLKNCYISIYYVGYAYVAYKATAQLVCTA